MEKEKCWLYDRCNHKDCDKDFCLRRYKVNWLYDNALLSETQRKRIALLTDNDGTDLAEFQQLADISNNIEKFVKEGNNLYIHSTNCGNGKTSWSLRLIQSFIDKIWPSSQLQCRALFISVPRFLLALKDNISTKNDYVEFIKQNIMTADLVVWDDIAAKVGTEFELNHLLSLIDGRLALNKSNIYTSNLGVNEIYNALGDRLASRITQYSTSIELHGADKRSIGGSR